ncbi:MAG TPA: hypothetical protein VD970_15120, partial [Acetobacteraceae bacterium]|nr:hypothetical protein [Acetobacteraceae bacterium]
ACQVPPVQTARLPADAVQAGAADPDRAAILATAHAFGAPGTLAGRPADAARAVANLEYLAASLPTDPRWFGMNPTVGLSLARGRDEARAALGIAPDAPPQPVIDRLYAASRALRAQDRTAAETTLAGAPFTAGGAGTLTRLAALPALPRANEAGALALAELWRLQDQGREGGAGGGEGGGAHP